MKGLPTNYGLVIVLVFLLTISLPAIVLAIPEVIPGEVVEGDSWSFTWNLTSGSSIGYGKVELFIYNDTGEDSVDFEYPPLVFEAGNYPNPPTGWSGTKVNDNYAYISGPEVTSYNVEVYFTGDIAKQNFYLDFLHFKYDTSGDLYFSSGSRWVIEDGNLPVIGVWDPNSTYDRTPSAIPEPSTLLLIGAGLVGLVGFRRKFHV